MPSRFLLNSARSVKRIVFSLVPAAFLLVALTFFLRFTEKSGIIGTERPDDRVAYGPLHLIWKKPINGSPHWIIGDSNMIVSRVPVKKSEKSFRIIVAGESFVLGTPYVSQYGNGSTQEYGDISNWLRAELTVRYPSRTIEVINAGVGAQNSSRVREIVAGLLRAEPDLVFAATGNNEGYVAKTTLNPLLHEWILYRAMKKVLLPGVRPSERSYFTPQDPDTTRIEENFRKNIEGMIKATREKSVPLVLATLPINLLYSGRDQGDHGTPLPEPQGDVNFHRGSALLKEGKSEEALEAFAQSDDRVFAARFMGQALERMGRYEEAREFYKIHVQNNPSNRTRPSYNEFIRHLRLKEGVLFVDLEKLFEDNSPNGIPGDTWFLDYCHLRWKGYHLAASAMADAVVAGKLIKGAPGEPLPKPTADEMIRDNGWERLYKLR